MTSDQLRQLAANIRQVVSDTEAIKTAQCANVLKAAHALNVLRRKVTTNVR